MQTDQVRRQSRDLLTFIYRWSYKAFSSAALTKFFQSLSIRDKSIHKTITAVNYNYSKENELILMLSNVISCSLLNKAKPNNMQYNMIEFELYRLYLIFRSIRLGKHHNYSLVKATVTPGLRPGYDLPATENGSIVERTYDWSQRSYDWSQRSWVIARGKSVAARS